MSAIHKVACAAGLCALVAFLAATGIFKTAQATIAALLSSPDPRLARTAYQAPHPLRRFTAACPLVYQRPTLKEIETGVAKPYAFGQTQRPACKRCGSGKDGRFCTYQPGEHPMCPADTQERLLQHFVGLSAAGSDWATQLLTLTPCDLWPFMHNRTTWLVGDSITQEFVAAVRCFFSEFWDEVKLPPAWRDPPDPAVVRATVTHELEPWCYEMDAATRLCHIRCNMGTPLVKHVLPHFNGLGGRRTDLWVLNFAIWSNNASEYAAEVGALVDYLREHAAELPFLVWRDASVQHFETRTGDFVGAAEPFDCRPLGGHPTAVVLHANGSLHTAHADLQVVVQGGWRNRIANPAMQALGIPIMHTWNQTVPLHFLHHHYNPKCAYEDTHCGDCSHQCHPGMYNVWVHHLYETLLASEEKFWHHVAGFPQILSAGL